VGDTLFCGKTLENLSGWPNSVLCCERGITERLVLDCYVLRDGRNCGMMVRVLCAERWEN